MRISLCWFCLHRRESGVACEAFPEGIPGDFLYGHRLHFHLTDGEQDIQFQPQENLTSAELRAVDSLDRSQRMELPLTAPTEEQSSPT